MFDRASELEAGGGEREVAEDVVHDQAGGAELAKLTIGKSVPSDSSRVYARGSRNQVLEVDVSRLGDLPKSMADVEDVPAADAGAASTAN